MHNTSARDSRQLTLLDLYQQRRFVAYNEEGGKKILKNPRTGRNAASNDPST
jgi:hypothetical protein